LEKQLSSDILAKIHLQIGKNVKKYRTAKKVSQLDLAEMIGYKSVSSISMAEINYKGIHFNIESLANIAKVLNIDIERLFEGVSEIIG
jgi:transcriptional regulator with XRE-family HTH domain